VKHKHGAGGWPELIRRRALIAMLGAAAVTLPRAARAQQAAVPVVGFLSLQRGG
jgi:hypothetical protein